MARTLSPDVDIEKLRTLRLKAGLTIAGLARKAGLAFMTVSNIEKGRYNGEPGTQVAIAEALGVDVEELWS